MRPSNLSAAPSAGFVELSVSDLADEFGFADGDLTAQWTEAWAASNWPSRHAGAFEDPGHSLWSYLSDRRLLIFLAKTHILPGLPDEFADKVFVVSGRNNPVQLVVPDGEDHFAWAIDMVVQADPLTVRVDADALVAACTEVFPERSSAWLSLHHELAWELALMGEPSSSRLAVWRDSAVALTDTIYSRIGDEASLLLAELLSSRGRVIDVEDALSLQELRELARVAEACCR